MACRRRPPNPLCRESRCREARADNPDDFGCPRAAERLEPGPAARKMRMGAARPRLARGKAPMPTKPIEPIRPAGAPPAHTALTEGTLARLGIRFTAWA